MRRLFRAVTPARTKDDMLELHVEGPAACGDHAARGGERGEIRNDSEKRREGRGQRRRARHEAEREHRGARGVPGPAQRARRCPGAGERAEVRRKRIAEERCGCCRRGRAARAVRRRGVAWWQRQRPAGHGASADDEEQRPGGEREGAAHCRGACARRRQWRGCAGCGSAGKQRRDARRGGAMPLPGLRARVHRGQATAVPLVRSSWLRAKHSRRAAALPPRASPGAAAGPCPDVARATRLGPVVSDPPRVHPYRADRWHSCQRQGSVWPRVACTVHQVRE
jgi:hypothetical protein